MRDKRRWGRVLDRWSGLTIRSGGCLSFLLGSCRWQGVSNWVVHGGYRRDNNHRPLGHDIGSKKKDKVVTDDIRSNESRRKERRKGEPRKEKHKHENRREMLGIIQYLPETSGMNGSWSFIQGKAKDMARMGPSLLQWVSWPLFEIDHAHVYFSMTYKWTCHVIESSFICLVIEQPDWLLPSRNIPRYLPGGLDQIW